MIAATDHELERDDRRVISLQRRIDEYAKLFSEALAGEGAYWPKASAWTHIEDAPDYDGEQAIDLFNAIRRAVKLQGASKAERWNVIERELLDSIHKYADITARG